MSVQPRTRTRIRQDISPLRYPGGKRKLVPLLVDLLSKTNTKVELLCEPFVGGGAVSIGLLEAGAVDLICLGDKDPLIAALWQTIFSNQASRLAKMVSKADVTLDEWRRQKAAKPRSRLGAAYKCLFLSRTSFSGCLTDATGPVGGVRQSGKYTIDCRFNKEKLSSRIMELSTLRARVLFVRSQGWKMTLKHVASRSLHRHSPERVLYYLDPPFFAKAPSLYREYFLDADHRSLAAAVSRLTGNYVLSYDDHSKAQALYEKNPGFARVNLQYSARIDDGNRIVASEILVSNLIAELRQDELLGELGCIIPLPHRRKKTIRNQQVRLLQQALANAS